MKNLLKVLKRLNIIHLLGVAITFPITQNGLKDFTGAVVIFLYEEIVREVIDADFLE